MNKILKILPRVRQFFNQLHFGTKDMETSYKEFQEETQKKLFYFLCLAIVIVHLLLLVFSLYYKQGASEIIIRSVTLVCSVVASLIGNKFRFLQKLLLLALLIFWENHIVNSLMVAFGETNLDLAFVVGDIFGIVEMMFALAAKDLRLRFSIHVAGSLGKILGLWDRTLIQPKFFFIVPLTGIITFIFCLSHDILDRKTFKTIFESREKLKKFQYLLSHDFPSSVIIMTSDFRTVLYSNQLFQENFISSNTSEDPEKIMNTLFQTFILDKDKCDGNIESTEETSLADFLRAMSKRRSLDNNEEKEVTTLVAIYTNQEGINKHFEVKFRKIGWDGQSSYALVLNDISDKQIVANLKIVDEQKDRVIATVSHELRTPINGIMGLLEMAMARIEDETSLRFLDHCKSCSKLLLYLVNSILDLSQLRHNSLRIVRDSFHLSEFLEEVKSLYLFQCQQKNIEFIVDVGPDVPAKIYTDRYRLTEILINLLGNAMKFTFKGFIKLAINIDETNDAKLCFRIKDTGIGIKEEDKPKLFQMFGKITHNNKNINKHGAGLGLTIANELVKALNGSDMNEKIVFESVFGEGSMFWFRINASSETRSRRLDFEEDSFEVLIDSIKLKEHTSSDLTSPTKIPRLYTRTKSPSNQIRFLSETPRDKDENSGNFTTHRHLISSQRQITSKEVLIVDDNPFNLMAASFVVEKLGFIASKAFNGQECLDMLESGMKQNKYYSLILTDIQMPILDGLEMSKIIKKKIEEGELYNVPIVALTATKLGKKEKEMYKEFGIAHSLEKPLAPEVVKETLNSLFPQLMRSSTQE